MDDNSTKMPSGAEDTAQSGTSNDKTNADKLESPLSNNTDSPIPRVYLCRHAEPTSKVFNRTTNRNYKYPDIVDPSLTARGELQCRETARCLERHLAESGVKITHILISPMSRTLETAAIIFKTAIEAGIQLVAVSELQTLGDGPNGTGLDLVDLKKLCASKYPNQVDLSKLEEGWNDPNHKSLALNGQYCEGRANVQFVKILLNQIWGASSDPVSIAVATHSSVLQYWYAEEEWHTEVIKPGRVQFDEDGRAFILEDCRVIKCLSEGKPAQ